MGTSFVEHNQKPLDLLSELRADNGIFLNTLLEYHSHGIAVSDTHGNILFANPQYIDHLQSQTSTSCHAIVDSAGAHQLKVNLPNSKEHNLNVHWEGSLLHHYQNRYETYLSVKLVPLTKSQNSPSAFLILMDRMPSIAETNSLLTQSESYLSQIISNYPQPIIVLDNNHRVIQWNKACEQSIGVSAAEMLGTTNQWRPFYPQKRPIMADVIIDGGSEALISDLYQNKYKQSRFIEGTYEAEDFFPQMGEHGRWLYFTASAIKNQQGEIIGAIESLIDISERKQAEAKVRLLNSELNQLIETYPQPILVLNKEHKVTHWNRASEQVLGPAAKDMIGTSDHWKAFYSSQRPIMADLVLEQNSDELIQNHYAGKYRKSPFIPGTYECEDYFPNMKSNDHGGRWLHFTASAIYNDSGEVIGAIESLIDISEQKKAESEVRALNNELEQRVSKRTSELKQANSDLHKAMNQLVNAEKLASLGNLVAGIAHELNTPIGNITTVASTLKEKSEEFHEDILSGSLKKSTLFNFIEILSDSTELMESSAHKAAELISHFKQVAVDQTSVRRRRFKLHDTIQETITSLTPVLKKTKFFVVNEVSLDIEMDSYPGPIEQIITNLVQNSILHGFEHQTEGLVNIQATASSDHATLIYKDNGAGIPKELIRKAFDPFYTTKLGSGGSGLGLYIIYNLVTAILGGKIELSSELGKGVLFTLTIPLNPPEPTEENPHEFR